MIERDALPKRVAVLMGGRSAEREISLLSGEAVLNALQGQGFEAEAVDPGGAIDATDCCKRLTSFDAAFVLLHGPGGEDGVIQAVLEFLQVPYTGSSVTASALTMNKSLTKQVWQSLQLPTPEFFLANDRSHLPKIAELSSSNRGLNSSSDCWIVKPCTQGSSIGMSMVSMDLGHGASSDGGLEAAYDQAAAYDKNVLIERFISGEEYTVTILGDRALAPIRVETSAQFYDYEAKYQAQDTRYILPSGLSAEAEAELKALSLRAFNALGCHGWGRVDLMRDQAGAFWLLEVNTVPGMTRRSLVPKAAAAENISFDQLVLEVLALASLEK